jgi:hypothetical protein
MRGTWLLIAALTLLPRGAAAQGQPQDLEFRVNTYTTGAQGLAAVASDSNSFMVVWASDQDGSSLGVFGQRYDAAGMPGMPLGLEFPVNTYTTDIQSTPSIAAASSGGFIVVWHSLGPDGSGYGVFGQRYASSGAPLGSEFRVNTYTTSHQGFPSVAADNSGDFVVVWDGYGQNEAVNGIFGQRFGSAGGLLGPEFHVNTYTTSFQGLPSVSSDASGNFVVVWQSNGPDGSSWGVFGQRYTSTGAPLGTEFRVNSYTTGVQRGPHVAADALGNFVVIWRSDDQDGSGIGQFGQRYASTGVPVGPEFRVNTYTTGDQLIASVDADSDGNFVVVWGSPQDGAGGGVFGQRYDSSGSPLGAEFRVNSYTTSEQQDPAVGADPSGNFVVVWNSYGQDGSSYGVFGQRYNMILPVELMHFRVE